MKTNYVAYTKLLEFRTVYFIKKFVTYVNNGVEGERQLESYGMHHNFEVACKYAGVEDEYSKAIIQLQLQQAKPKSLFSNDNPVTDINQRANRRLYK
jgi:hypothetical protein